MNRVALPSGRLVTRSYAIFAILVACTGSSDPPDEPVAESEPPRVAAKRAPSNRRDIDVYVDHIPVATIGEAQLPYWPQIDTQLPPDATLGAWLVVTLETDADPIELHQPASKYPGTLPVLFLAEDRSISFGMFDEKSRAARGAPKFRVDHVREVRVELAKDQRSATERAFARACTEPKRGEEKPPVGRGRWQGTAYQFNINEYWTIDLTIDLADSKVGDKVGSVTYHGHKCRGHLYRLPDQDGKRRVVERFWHNENGICVEACILQFACNGTSLEYRAAYPDGSYVAHAKLSRAK